MVHPQGHWVSSPYTRNTLSLVLRFNEEYVEQIDTKWGLVFSYVTISSIYLTDNMISNK